MKTFQEWSIFQWQKLVPSKHSNLDKIISYKWRKKVSMKKKNWIFHPPPKSNVNDFVFYKNQMFKHQFRWQRNNSSFILTLRIQYFSKNKFLFFSLLIFVVKKHAFAPLLVLGFEKCMKSYQKKPQHEYTHCNNFILENIQKMRKML